MIGLGGALHASLVVLLPVLAVIAAGEARKGEAPAALERALGDPARCLAYEGLPPGWSGRGVAGAVWLAPVRSGLRPAVAEPGTWVDATPVTQAQFRVFVASSGYSPKARVQAEPAAAVRVRRGDALAYAAWAGGRLPDRAFWRALASGGERVPGARVGCAPPDAHGLFDAALPPEQVWLADDQQTPAQELREFRILRRDQVFAAPGPIIATLLDYIDRSGGYRASSPDAGSGDRAAR